jgi:hypothetical protein
MNLRRLPLTLVFAVWLLSGCQTDDDVPSPDEDEIRISRVRADVLLIDLGGPPTLQIAGSLADSCTSFLT